MKQTLTLIALCVAVGTAGCSSDSSSEGGTGGTDRNYSASIVRTTYGIPHITGSDFGNLGYGLGYAYAQDNFCVLMREIVIANGEAARYWGEDFANSDFVYQWANSDEFIEHEFIPAASETMQDLIDGYAAGFNRYLDETGVDALAEGPEGCRGEEWVRPVTSADLAKRLHKLILLGGLDAGQVNAIDRIMDGSAAAPTQSMASVLPVGAQSVELDSSWVEQQPVDRMGSNAYGIGAEGSQTDYGILLGNPHFPWSGPQRFYVSHLTVPGEYDMMGGSLHGVPLILIGFNKDVAWSHTVSTAQRFTFFELELLPDDPFKYRYDDEVRDIEAVPYTIQVRLEDGTLEERTENIYFSHYGPIMDLGGLVELVGGWPTAAGTVFAFADANLTNTRILDQFLKMGQSTSIDELEDALKDIGIPWVNTIAADRAGTGYYADISTVPNVTQEQLVDCAEGFSSLITDFGVASLNGSRSECEWGTDPDGPEGLIGFGNLPKLRTSESVPYVANANDSYWLSHPNQLLEGFSPLMGRNGKEPPEGIAQGDRTRQCFIQGDERLAGTDGLSETGGFTVELVQQVHQGSRNLPGELAQADVGSGGRQRLERWRLRYRSRGSAALQRKPSRSGVRVRDPRRLGRSFQQRKRRGEHLARFHRECEERELLAPRGRPECKPVQPLGSGLRRERSGRHAEHVQWRKRDDGRGLALRARCGRGFPRREGDPARPVVGRSALPLERRSNRADSNPRRLGHVQQHQCRLRRRRGLLQHHGRQQLRADRHLGRDGVPRRLRRVDVLAVDRPCFAAL